MFAGRLEVLGSANISGGGIQVLQESPDDSALDSRLKPVWRCSVCSADRTKPEKRLPNGWKRKSEQVYCDICWANAYILRAITVQVVSPIDQTWTELRSALKEMWIASTTASNWILTELYHRDVRRSPAIEKLPAMPNIYLYPELREYFPELPSSTVASLENSVKAKYRARRYETIWTAKSSLPTYRYPTPFPVPNQAWTLRIDTGRPIISVRIGDKRISLRLKGPRFRPQFQALRAIEAGAAVQGQLELYQRGEDILCKMTAWLPREACGIRSQKSGTLYIRTSADAMIVAVDANAAKLWTYHGDHIRRWSAEHRKQLMRWADDSKAESRPHVPFSARREHACRRYRNRMDTACHQIAAMIAGYAQRRRVATVEYSNADQSFCMEFPWYRLRELIREKCDEAGIAFEYSNGSAITQNESLIITM